MGYCTTACCGNEKGEFRTDEVNTETEKGTDNMGGAKVNQQFSREHQLETAGMTSVNGGNQGKQSYNPKGTMAGAYGTETGNEYANERVYNNQHDPGTMDWGFLKQNQHIITKLQALYRGHRARRQTAFMMKSKRADSRYFTIDESRETVSKNRVYDPHAKREKRTIYTFKTGATYEGEWIGGFRDGFGVQRWPDGAVYEGQWKDNRAHGKGKFTHIDGDVYEGSWVNDKANGYGAYYHVNGAMYEGNWKDDLQHGHGRESWNDGSVYDGQYMAGKKHGQGTYSWNDGSKYTGDWFENKIKGFGTYSWLDGRMFQGEWLDNNMDGMGVYTWSDGRSYMGEYKDDKKHGYGIYKWADGRLYLGQWQRGKQHGLGVYRTAETAFKYGLWEGGKRIEWFDNETLHEINTGQRDFRRYFKLPENQMAPLYPSFEKPDYFDSKLYDITQRFDLRIDYTFQ